MKRVNNLRLLPSEKHLDKNNGLLNLIDGMSLNPFLCLDIPYIW